MIVTVTMNTAIDKFYLVDKLTPFSVMRVQEVNNTAGGKGINVARVAAIAGEQVTALGIVGGLGGRLFLDLLEGSGINCAFTQVRGETRCCVNIRDNETCHSTELLEPGSLVSPEELARFVADFTTAIESASIIAVSGSLPPGVPKDFYAKLITIAKSAGKRVLLDTSGEALSLGINAKPTFVKPNTDEIRQLLSVDINSVESLREAAIKLHETGIPIVAVSRGADGALVVCDEGVFFGTTPDVPVINTVGCGDSMVAGFAIGLSRGYTMEETVRYSIAISTANAMTPQTGSFDPANLESLLCQIKVRRL